MKRVLFLLLLCLTGSLSYAATNIAASASWSDVQSAVNSSSSGDTVLIPDGTVTWSDGITNTTAKQVIVRAQNYTATSQPTTNTSRSVIITYSGTNQAAFTMASGNTYHCGVGGIRFLPPSAGSQGDAEHGIWGYVRFSGSGGKPPLLFDCHFVGNDRENVTAGEAAFLSIESLGGVVWNTCFDGTQVPDGTSVAEKGMGGAGIHIISPRAWATASTMGSLDVDGLVNVYFEDCRWVLWGQSDVDDNGRLVVRNSTMDGTGWQTHGFTSAYGGRHVEMYDCSLVNTVSGRNHSRYFWLRAGTALFTGNSVSDSNTGYGVPVLLNIGDNTSPSGSYLIDRQPGCGHNGSDFVSDPIYLWSNTGGSAYAWDVVAAWSSYVVDGRDVFANDGAKPDYASLAYPHPLRGQLESPATGSVANIGTLRVGTATWR